MQRIEDGGNLTRTKSDKKIGQAREVAICARLRTINKQTVLGETGRWKLQLSC